MDERGEMSPEVQAAQFAEIAALKTELALQNLRIDTMAKHVQEIAEHAATMQETQGKILQHLEGAKIAWRIYAGGAAFLASLIATWKFFFGG